MLLGLQRKPQNISELPMLLEQMLLEKDHMVASYLLYTVVIAGMRLLPGK